jgi:riboflavin synthase
LTVVNSSQEGESIQIAFDVIPESLKCTTLGSISVGDYVNVERSLKSDSLIGGHFVQGHVDGVEKLLEVEMMDDSESRIRISMNCIDKDTIVPKGSVTIDGVSLTIASVSEDWFEVALIPTTLSDTTLGRVSIGDHVNIETDILARTIVQVMRRMQIT